MDGEDSSRQTMGGILIGVRAVSNGSSHALPRASTSFKLFLLQAFLLVH